MWSVQIKEFINELNKNAPLNGSRITKQDNNNSNIYSYKYPYKPILLISIISNINDVNELFNNKIYIRPDSSIVHTYYELLSNSETFYSHLKLLKSKSRWYDVFNEKIKKQVVFNIFDQPVPALFSNDNNFFKYDKKEKWIMFNIDLDEQKLIELKKYILDQAKITLWKCLPDYKGLTIKEIVNYQGYIMQQILMGLTDSDKSEVSRRKYQHIFSKIIFNRDFKCTICCLDIPELLEAAHIKPYRVCDNDIDRYSENNGLLMCRNHHKLYDAGFFTFTNDWKIQISKYLETKDADLLIKTFEPCFINTLNKKSYGSSNDYLDYHRKNIYKG